MHMIIKPNFSYVVCNGNNGTSWTTAVICRLQKTCIKFIDKENRDKETFKSNKETVACQFAGDPLCQRKLNSAAVDTLMCQWRHWVVLSTNALSVTLDLITLFCFVYFAISFKANNGNLLSNDNSFCVSHIGDWNSIPLRVYFLSYNFQV